MTTQTDREACERIAKALGWRIVRHMDEMTPPWTFIAKGDARASLLDYFTDPAALSELERLVREKGWWWEKGTQHLGRGIDTVCVGNSSKHLSTTQIESTFQEALARAVGAALEGENG